MGCGNTKTRPITQENEQYDFQRSIENVQMTWPNVKRIDNLGPKIFARVLHVYPVLKRVSNVSPTLKTEADLLRANEVKDLGNMLLAIYSDLIKNAHYDLNDRLQRKAIILNRQQIKPRLIKVCSLLFFVSIHFLLFKSILVRVFLILQLINFILN